MTDKTEKNGTDDQKHVKVQRFSRSLKIALKPEEIATRADRAAHLLVARDEKADEAKTATAHIKAQIKELEAELRKVSGEVRDKHTWGQVSCERRYDFRLGRVYEVRLDTDVTIEERPMTDLERQMSLDGVDGDEDDAPDSKPEPLPTQKKKRAKKPKAAATEAPAP